MGEEGLWGSGAKKRARWSFGEAEMVEWKALEIRWARRRSRCGRWVRICSRISGRWRVRVVAESVVESIVVWAGVGGCSILLAVVLL